MIKKNFFGKFIHELKIKGVSSDCIRIYYLPVVGGATVVTGPGPGFGPGLVVVAGLTKIDYNILK